MKKTVSLVLVLSMIAAVAIGFGAAENTQTLSNTERRWRSSTPLLPAIRTPLATC